MAATDDSKSSREEGGRESWTSHCKLFTQGQTKENGALERVQAGKHINTQMTKLVKVQIVEENPWQKDSGKTGGNGLVETQDTLQLRDQQEATHTHICMPSVGRRVLKKLKEQN